MNVIEWIQTKRDGGELTESAIRQLMAGYTDGRIPDYQMAAWAMAVHFAGLSARETAQLTLAMRDSGERVDLSAIPGIKADKHSTGGVGDTASLIVLPLVVAAGVPMAKMAGRGLGHTGGTIDKLEAIPGISTALTVEDLVAQVRRVGLAVAAQTDALVPADKKFYALRELTGTVDIPAFIASSIMSKKLAGGADVIMLDVKTGDGALLPERAQARALAQTMVHIGHQAGIRTAAIISDMSQPLGPAIGNALEVAEAIRVLKGGGSDRLRTFCLELGASLLTLANAAADLDEGRAILQKCLEDGRGLSLFGRFVSAQGGDAAIIADPSRLPTAPVQWPVTAMADGVVQAVRTRRLGEVSVRLGAGRLTRKARVDPAVGLRVTKRIGDAVVHGETLAVIHAQKESQAQAVEADVRVAFVLGEAATPRPLIYERIPRALGASKG